jgi:hypothetical protein
VNGPIPVASLSKAWVCGSSLLEIVASNPAGGMEICLLWVLRVVRQSSLHRDNHSPTGVQSVIVCSSVIVKPRQGEVPGLLGAVAPWEKVKILKFEISYLLYCSH